MVSITFLSMFIPSIYLFFYKKKKKRKYKWKYINIYHYEMTRDADKRVYIDWEKRNKETKWWEEQYNSQYGKII